MIRDGGESYTSGPFLVSMGVGKLDNANGNKPGNHGVKELGLLLTLREGDVIAHPAGTGYSNISDEGNYRYLSLFPNVSMALPLSLLFYQMRKLPT